MIYVLIWYARLSGRSTAIRTVDAAKRVSWSLNLAMSRALGALFGVTRLINPVWLASTSILGDPRTSASRFKWARMSLGREQNRSLAALPYPYIPGISVRQTCLAKDCMLIGDSRGRVVKNFNTA